MRASIPETQLTVFEIPQVPGYRRGSHSVKGIDESFVTTVYAIPIAIINPYLAGGLFVDYLVRGRYHLIPKHPQSLAPAIFPLLTAPAAPAQNPASTGVPTEKSSFRGSHANASQVAGADSGDPRQHRQPEIQSSLQETGATNE